LKRGQPIRESGLSESQGSIATKRTS